jgi:hypothetical protein
MRHFAAERERGDEKRERERRKETQQTITNCHE